jgi:hypothetical protein
MAVELKEVIEKATTKKKTIVKGAKGTGRKTEWWDKKYKKLKKEAVKALREWNRTKMDRNRFLEVKRRYRERCRERKKQKGDREEKGIKEIRTENARMVRVLHETAGRKEEGKAETEMKKK